MLADAESTVPVRQAGTANASNDIIIIIRMHQNSHTYTHTHLLETTHEFRIPAGISSSHAASAGRVICVTVVSCRHSSKSTGEKSWEDHVTQMQKSSQASQGLNLLLLLL